MFQEKSKTIFISLIALSPFGLFLFRQLDPWHGMGMYIQIAILVLFSLSLKNRPLGVLTLYLGLLTSYVWGITLIHSGQYALKIFLPFFNFLCFVILYKVIQEKVNRDTIETLFKWLSYSLIGLLFYCVLQKLNLDQFFVDNSISTNPDQIVGTLGNPSHLAGLLAIIQPFFFNNKLALILLWVLLIIIGSASGVIVGILVLLFYFFHTHKNRFFTLLSLSTILGVVTLISHKSFFTFSGRLWAWQKTLDIFIKSKSQITGLGLGSFSLINLNSGPCSTWRHLHLEYFQVLFECGVIGLGLVSWCIYDYFKTFSENKNNLTIKIATIFFGFCMLSFFTFPAHLWLLSLFGILSYSLLYAIKEKSI